MAVKVLVGCNDNNADKLVRCVKEVPAQNLENALSYYIGNSTKPTMAFTPSIDNKTVFSNWTQRAQDGTIAKTVRESSLVLVLDL